MQCCHYSHLTSSPSFYSLAVAVNWRALSPYLSLSSTCCCIWPCEQHGLGDIHHVHNASVDATFHIDKTEQIASSGVVATVDPVCLTYCWEFPTTMPHQLCTRCPTPRRLCCRSTIKSQPLCLALSVTFTLLSAFLGFLALPALIRSTRFR